MFSIHDNVIVSYEVNLENGTIVLHTIDTWDNDSNVDILFSDVLAHLFECELPGSVILEMKEYEIESFINGFDDILQKRKAYGWPTDYTTKEDLVKILKEQGYRYYVIVPSYGFSGIVLAKCCELKKL